MGAWAVCVAFGLCPQFAISIGMSRRQHMARVACVCPLCPGMHVGDERHYVLDCPSFHDIRIRHSRLFDDSHGATRLFIWPPHQKGFASCLLQMLENITDQLEADFKPSDMNKSLRPISHAGCEDEVQSHSLPLLACF